MADGASLEDDVSMSEVILMVPLWQTPLSTMMRLCVRREGDPASGGGMAQVKIYLTFESVFKYIIVISGQGAVT